MSNLTKQDIDALVDGLKRGRDWPAHDQPPTTMLDVDGWEVPADTLKSDLYLAAGLTAEGARKPERVRCHMVRDYYGDGRPLIVVGLEPDRPVLDITPGWFVPDGAE